MMPHSFSFRVHAENRELRHEVGVKAARIAELMDDNARLLSRLAELERENHTLSCLLRDERLRLSVCPAESEHAAG